MRKELSMLEVEESYFELSEKAPTRGDACSSAKRNVDFIEACNDHSVGINLLYHGISASSTKHICMFFMMMMMMMLFGTLVMLERMEAGKGGETELKRVENSSIIGMVWIHSK